MTGNISRNRVFLVAGSRTPIGKFGGSLSRTPVDLLAAHTMSNALRRAGITPGTLDGVYYGHGYQSPFTPNTAQVSAQRAGIPANVPAATVQRQCGSGMESIHLASDRIALGKAQLMLAGGAESMSTIPYVLPGSLRFEGRMSKLFSWTKFGPYPTFFAMADNGIAPAALRKDTKTVFMAATAQRLADTYGISREESDAYALRSQKLAAKAIADGRFALEIDPIATSRGFFVHDEHPFKKSSMEGLAKLKGVYGQRTITAGNTSGINDAAASVILASEDALATHNLQPLSEIKDWCVVGIDPEQMGAGPVPAIEKLLADNNLKLEDIDLIEINEAFASQVLACVKLLGIDMNKLNVNGGAIALGHPIAMSGTRVVLSLSHELARRNLKLGIAAACIGGGMGIATLVARP